ncbi:hypothetical protein BJ166DRAFT_276876 [Pestalotiopsis sp. NC0098]|nr:hypothetical protein BJ166DRAFT_276876 [Pestalotiopsis sp. NC0098]
MSATAPVVMDRFASANGDFYAESSGNNRHRRATVPELKEHFQSSGSGKDKPAHWYEAQLIHYGLPPSKTKAVAFKRLFDASNTGGLSVPAHITKLESDLKKEWTKRDRDAKKEAKGQMVGVTKTTEKATAVKKTTAGAGAKRKASESLDVTVSVGGIDFKMSASNSSATQSTPKKAKTTKTTTAKTTKTAAAAKPVKESPKAKPAPKTTKAAAAPKEKKTPAKAAPKAAATSSQSSATKVPPTMARRGSLSQGSARGAAASSPPQPRTKQTARRGGSFAARGGLSHSSARDVEIASPPRPRTKQTARRGGGFPAYGGHSFTASQHSQPYDDEDDNDEPPPPYSEYGYDNTSDSGSGDNDDDEPLDKLGLLNGRYEIESADVSEQWPHLGSDFSLVLTLAGDQLWGTFDLGLYEGVLRFDVRPYESSREPLEFTWRGQESDGPIFYGNGNSGSITFLGGGRIKGKIDAMDIHFSGRREAGQGTRSEVNITTMRNEWNSYTEQEYERLNRARWGGSSW